jgi:hypothetical protein
VSILEPGVELCALHEPDVQRLEPHPFGDPGKGAL